jgi:hypothetical protein
MFANYFTVFYYFMKLLLVFFLLLPSFCALAQSSPVATNVENGRANGSNFLLVKPFLASTTTDLKALEFAPSAQFLDFDPTALHDLWLHRPEGITLILPYHGEEIKVDLVTIDIFSERFKVVISDGDLEVPYNRGVHFQGVLQNDESSLAGVSFFENEIIGVVSSRTHQNLVLGRLDIPGNTTKYILYSDAEVTASLPFNCGALHPNTPEHVPAAPTPEFFASGCVNIFFEVDKELYDNKGSVVNTVNYITGMFTQMAVLFTNEVVPTKISQIYVWVTPDPYPANPSGGSNDILDQFYYYRSNKFDGDIAHLVGIGGNNLGGIAYIDQICVDQYALAYSDIDASYQNVPTYSWTINVITHECGHVMGSDHTHDCVWFAGGTWSPPPATGNVALDNCYAPVGGCSAGPAPTNGGTIMSYCHLVGAGVNFANGFGPQPGDLIRWKNGPSWSPCLAASCSTNSCNAPTSISIVNTYSTSIRFSWSAVSGATSYGLQWRRLPNSAWNTVNNITSPYLLTGLAFNDTLEVQFRTVCATGNSPYSTGLIAKTNTTAPVELLFFREKNVAPNQPITLEWATASEVNSAKFRVEKSIDALNWREIGSKNAHGNTTTLSHYELADAAEPLAVQYYRLTEISLDGIETRYESVAVKRLVKNCQPAVQPNPSRGIFEIKNPCGEEDIEVLVLDVMGSIVAKKTLTQARWESGLPAGIYALQYRRDGAIVKTERLVIQ